MGGGEGGEEREGLLEFNRVSILLFARYRMTQVSIYLREEYEIFWRGCTERYGEFWKTFKTSLDILRKTLCDRDSLSILKEIRDISALFFFISETYFGYFGNKIAASIIHEIKFLATVRINKINWEAMRGINF